ncbi:MAG: hypothetical protein ABJA67_14265, partial [Chthonomonadales bacterium]
WMETDGKTLTAPGTKKPSPCPPELLATIKGVLVKLQKELIADQASSKNDFDVNQKDKQQLQTDLATYQSIQSANSYDSTYEVDYGTSSIPVGNAISLTEKDIQDNAAELMDLQKDQLTNTADIERITRVLPLFGVK